MTDITEDGNHISGTVNAQQAGTLLLTFPYDEGWTIKVDGEETDTYRVGDALTGIDLEAGTHTIEMNFIPEGLWQGSMISIVSIGLYLLSAMLEQYGQKKKKQEETEGETEDETYIFG